MLKKLSAIFLIVVSWLVLTSTPAQADLALPPCPPDYNYDDNENSPGIGMLCSNSPPAPRPTPFYNSPRSTTFDSILISLPLYLIVFALNYTIEYGIGLTFRFSKHKHFPLIILLMNLTTHPLLTLIMTIFAVAFINNYPAIIFLEFMIVLIEALIFGWWYNKNKPKNTPILTLAQALGFSFVINLASFLVGEIIAWMAPLMVSSIPSLNYYVLCLIVLFFVITVIWIFRRPHMITKPKISP